MHLESMNAHVRTHAMITCNDYNILNAMLTCIAHMPVSHLLPVWHSFTSFHTKLLRVAGAAPEAALKALQGPLQQALQHAQDEDRPQTFAAAEVLSGLVSAPASFQHPAGRLFSVCICFIVHHTEVMCRFVSSVSHRGLAGSSQLGRAENCSVISLGAGPHIDT